ncbi:MAG: hypothetical protein WB699_07935, partial [Bacteroidota bacterium]
SPYLLRRREPLNVTLPSALSYPETMAVWGKIMRKLANGQKDFPRSRGARTRCQVVVRTGPHRDWRRAFGYPEKGNSIS